MQYALQYENPCLSMWRFDMAIVRSGAMLEPKTTRARRYRGASSRTLPLKAICGSSNGVHGSIAQVLRYTSLCTIYLWCCQNLSERLGTTSHSVHHPVPDQP